MAGLAVSQPAVAELYIRPGGRVVAAAALARVVTCWAGVARLAVSESAVVERCIFPGRKGGGFN